MTYFVEPPDLDTLPDRLSQGQADCWRLLTSIRPLHAHEDEQISALAFDATEALVSLMRALNRLEAVVGEEE